MSILYLLCENMYLYIVITYNSVVCDKLWHS